MDTTCIYDTQHYIIIATGKFVIPSTWECSTGRQWRSHTQVCAKHVHEQLDFGPGDRVQIARHLMVRSEYETTSIAQS